MRNNISMKVLLFMVSFVLLFTSMGESVLAAKFVGRKKPLRKASEEIERHTGTKGILLKKGIGNTYVLDDKIHVGLDNVQIFMIKYAPYITNHIRCLLI